MSDAGTTTSTDAPTETTEPEASTAETDWKAEFEKLQKDARKWEDRAKSNASASKELAELRIASMSDTEKAVAAAREEATRDVLRSYGARLVDAEVKAAAAGRSVDVEALLEGLDRSRFLDDDGEPKVKEIVAWVMRIAPATETTTTGPPRPDLGQGVRPATGISPGDDALLDAIVAKVGSRQRR